MSKLCHCSFRKQAEDYVTWQGNSLIVEDEKAQIGYTQMTDPAQEKLS